MSQDSPVDLRTKATGAILWVIAERWGSRLLSLLVFTVLARFVAPEQFGVISLAMVVTALMQVFVDSGFSKALIQRKELAPKDASTAFWTSLAMALVLCALVAGCAPLIADAFGEPGVTNVLRALSLALPLSALSLTPQALLERQFDFRSLSVRQLAGALAGAGIAIPMAILGAGVWALVAQQLVTAGVAVLVLWRSTHWRPTMEFSGDSFRSLANAGVSILGTELLDAVQGNIDKLVVGAFFTAEQLGYYFLAQRIGTILVELVTSVMARVSLTTFSRVQDDPARLNRVLRQMTFAASAVGVPIFALVAVLAPQLVPFAFGDGWEDSIPILWILAPSWALSSVMTFDRGLFIATGHARAALLVALLQNAVGVVLVFALLPLGVYGVTLSRWSRVATWPVRLVMLHRLIHVRIGPYLAQILRCALAVAPSTAAIAVLQQTGWASASGAFWTFACPLGLASLLTYAALLWLIAGESGRSVLSYIASTVVKKLPLRRSRA